MGTNSDINLPLTLSASQPKWGAFKTRIDNHFPGSLWHLSIAESEP